jgi:hypothetical protein
MKKIIVLNIIATVAFACLFLSGCSSSTEVSDNSNPYADISEGFMSQEPRTFHDPRFLPSDYFYKQCSQHLIDNFYSKTEYFCN